MTTKLIRNTVLALSVMVLAPCLSAQTCQPAGSSNLGPSIPNFDYVSNGTPNSANCWSIMNTTVGSAVTSCGSNAFEFNYGGSISQSITIPTTDTTFNRYQMSYILDFQDPNHDGTWNVLGVQVKDYTTNTVLESDSYSGSQPNLSCIRRDLTVVSGNLAGHSIGIQISGSRGYTNTHIGVGNIQFWGWTQ